MNTLLARFAQMLFVLWVVASILFFMFRLMPGDPTVAYIDTSFNAEQVAQLKRTFGLDRPLSEQYVLYLGNLVRGEFGDSFHHRQPVLKLLASVLPNTIILTLTGLIVAYVFGTLVGATPERLVSAGAHATNGLTSKWSRRARRSCAILSPRRAAHLQR